jgi:cytochrome c oxidase subunit 3
MSPTLTPTETEVIPKTTGGGRGPNGGARDDGDGGRGEPERGGSAEKYRLGTWLAIAGILMMFFAFTSAYVVSKAQTHLIELPPVLWLTTGVILASSVTIEAARRALKRGLEDSFQRWILVTAVLGAVFLAGQVIAWQQLANRGYYLVTNPHSWYAYLLTALHGLHLLGGLLALGYVLVRSRWAWAAPRKRGSVEATAVYWHVMDGLWLYLFILLFHWR